MNIEIEKSAETESHVAHFSDRVLAFSIDYALFTVGFFASMKAVFPEHPVLLNPHGMKWAFLWIGLFLIYNALMSCDGRVTLGKRLLGLRVIDLEGEPLSLPQSLLRSMGYLLSSIFGAGFLWMLSNKAGQGFHDLMAGSGVIEEHPKTSAQRSLVKAGAFLCLLAFGATWTWENFVAAKYYRNMTIAYSHVGLEEIAVLQETHKLTTGRYADDILLLAALSGTPKSFMRDMAVLFEPEEGIKISATEKTFRIEAVARDLKHTPVSYYGPKSG